MKKYKQPKELKKQIKDKTPLPHIAKPKHSVDIEIGENSHGKLYCWNEYQYGLPLDLSILSWEPRIMKHPRGWDQGQDIKQLYKGGKKKCKS
ncbi:MAG TPA: hypothetical protein VMW50_13975 [Dehalococcoidia bacterium]|nr:hypothetical protein [Dehalococcoidia bacterium]